MNISTLATSKAMNLIAKEFKDCIGACAIIGIEGDTVVAKVNAVVYEICAGTIVELERTRSSIIRKVNKWIRENISEVYNVHPVETVETQEKCNCLEKIGTIYNHPESRALQQYTLKYSDCAYGIRLLDLHHSSGKLYRDELEQAKRRAYAWAHPDKGGDSEMFDMITRSYEGINRTVTRKGYL